MKEILDIIVSNTFLFIGVILFLVATFLVLVRSIVKTINNRKIPIYEEENELEDLNDVKENDIIEKPAKKKEAKIKDEIEEPKAKVKQEEKEENTEFEKNDVEEEVVETSEEIIEEEVKENIIEEKDDEFPEVIIVDDDQDREELEQIDDKEIEERIDKEHKKDLKEAINDSENEEIKELLTDMSTTKEVNPEEVVKIFEEEQEAHSIISYQELVDVVKNRDNDFIDELESKPLATVSDFIVEKEKASAPDVEVLEIIEQLEKSKDTEKEPKVEELMAISDDDIELLEPSVEEIEVLEPIINEYVEKSKNKKEAQEIIQDPLPEIPDDGRFKKTDVISPIFGKLDETIKIDFPKVEKFNREIEDKKAREEKIMKSVVSKIELPKEINNDNIDINEKEATEALKSFSNIFENISDNIKENKIIKEEELDEEIESLTAVSDISKNEDFLKALKDFRNSL